MATVYQPIYGTGTYGNSFYGTTVLTDLPQAVGTSSLGSIQANISEPVAGVSATTTVASVAITGFEIDLTERVDSVPATLSLGTIKPNWTISISGVSDTGQQNSVVINRGVIVTGIPQLTLSLGTFEVQATEALLSVVGVTQLGTLQPNITEKVSGIAGTSAAGSLSPSDAITVFNASDFSRQRTIKLQPKQTSQNRRAA